MTKLPFFVGQFVSSIPYQYRPGLSFLYTKRQREICSFRKMNISQKKEFIFHRVKNIASFAVDNVPFYKDLYRDCNVNPNNFHCFEDLKELPVINKEDLQRVDLEYRSCFQRGRVIANTGGSSGEPLSLYIQPSSIPHEWAHMHYVWANLGFCQSDLKIVFGGRSDVKNLVQYDSARHQINVDMYREWDVIANELQKKFFTYKPKYLHGYPSAIFDFIFWLHQNQHPLLETLKNNIYGIFLSSEYPSPQHREKIERLIDCKSISWYGHTERVILAFEEKKYQEYTPFMTYGFTESFQNKGEDYEYLIGTSYYNYASPLIRYNTGDIISTQKADKDIIEVFKIQKGRAGEYVLDRNNNKIFLTALIFGRHHKIFDYSRYLQVRQLKKGEIILLITPISSMRSQEAKKMFDSSNLNLDIFYQITSKPFKTEAGKVPLLIK